MGWLHWPSFGQGLFFWAGIVGWAVLAEAGGDPAAMKKTLGGTIFGACLAWVALVVSLLIPVPPEGWMWVPRLAVTVALSLYLLEMAAGVELFSAPRATGRLRLALRRGGGDRR